MNIYDIAKSRVGIIEIAKYYGLEVNGSKSLCPFHKEQTPSLSFKENFFMCFGCGEKGDSITLVSKLFNISPHEAIVKINSDFCLGLINGCLALNRA